MLNILTGLLVTIAAATVIFCIAGTIADLLHARYTPTDTFPTLEAEEKARRLFYNSLSPEQRKQYNTNRHFTVVGNDTQQTYLIRCDSVIFNINQLNSNGSTRKQLCFVPQNAYYLPRYDIYLAQKLSLEGNETATVATANKIPNFNPFATSVYTYN